jgi:hypothetical protein
VRDREGKGGIVSDRERESKRERKWKTETEGARDRRSKDRIQEWRGSASQNEQHTTSTMITGKNKGSSSKYRLILKLL